VAIAQPVDPLWDQVKLYGEDQVWPMDSEDAARALGTAWQGVADQVGEKGFQASQIGTTLSQAWKDGAGQVATQKVGAYFDGVKAVALQISQVGIMGEFYAQHLEAAKNAVKQVVAQYSQAYAQSMTPGPGSALGGRYTMNVAGVVAEMCKEIVDREADAVKNTLAKQAGDATAARKKDLMKIPGYVATTGSAANSAWKSSLEKQAAALAENPKTAADAQFIKDQAAANSKLVKGLSRGLSGATAVVGAGIDIANGTPPVEAITAAGASWVAATAAGAAIGTLIPVPVVGTLAGAAGGFVVGAFTSGAVKSLFEHGPDHIGTAIESGWDSVKAPFS
jgi:hypothetical protein